MPRKPTLTEYTNAESHGAFKTAVQTLGHGVDPRTDRRHAILIDGVALGERLGEMRKPGTAFYEKTFAEANAVAHLAVDIDLDHDGQVNVLRLGEPQPDTELLVNGSRIAFVEQTMVMDQAAHRLSLDVEAINSATRECDAPAVMAAFAQGMLTLRLNEIPEVYYDTGIPIDAVVREVFALTRSFTLEEEHFHQLDPSRFPFLAAMKALGSYRLNGTTYNPVMSLVDHGRPQLVRNVLAERLRTKREKAANYPRASRPLWLLLNIDIHFGYQDFTSVTREVIESEGPIEYDRIIVDQTYAKPLILDFVRA